MRTSSRLHAVTWLLWAVAGAATVQLAPSPVYVALVIALAALVVEVHRLDTAMARAFPLLVGLGVTFALLRVVLTALTTHGVGHVLFTLPEATLPRLLGGFTVGGTVEAPVVLQAAAEGFAVVGVLAVFGAFNAVISHHELVQAVPRAFHEPGLIATVGLAFVPSTMQAVQQAREADLARTGGRRVGRRRLLRQLLPVLESGMERAVRLAESMDSRGFARARGGRREQAAGWTGLAALLCLAGAFVALVGRAQATASALGGAGVVLLAVAIVLSSQASRRTRYRPRRMTGLDWAVAAVVWGAPLGLVALQRVADPVLRWATDPLAFPEFSPLVAGLLLLLGVPAVVRPVPPVTVEAPPAPGAGVGGCGGGGTVTAAVSWSAVAFAYPDRDRTLDGVDLALDPGDVAVVVGSSGSGKSTFLRTVNGLVPHTSGGRFAGEVVVDGRSTRDHPPRDLADVVGFVHQDPEAQFVVDHVEHDLAFVLENLGTDARAMRRRVEEVLDALGIAHLRDRSPATLSGGERQRCAIAGALAAAPSVLVLDEPTSELDPQGAEDVLAAVGRLNADLGTTVLLAEHRLERVAALAHRALQVDAGRIVADGDPATVVAGYDGAPPVTQLGRLLGWAPLPLTVREAQLRARAGGPEGRPAAPAAGAPEVAAPGEVVRRAVGVEVRLGGRTVLRETTLDLRRGEVVALLGRNGAGKTTLLRALGGLHAPDRGRIEGAPSVSYVPQDPNTLLFASTVRGELEETLRLRGQDDDGRVERWLDRLRLGALADRHPRSLSSGERQRVAVAAIAVGGAEVLLLDEPTRGIDAPSRAALRAAVAEHAAGGGTVVLATHDIELAAQCATRVVVLGAGEVVADGPAREVLAGSLFAPQVLRVLPPFLTVDEVRAAVEGGARP